MDISRTLPLQPLSLSSRPLSTQSISWSCDAELAIATSDGIFIYLPSYPCSDSPSQFSLATQTSGIFRPNPAINSRLCAFAGCPLPSLGEPDDVGDRIHGATYGSISGAGAAAIGQVVKLEWSPNALGCNNRQILTALTTHGHIVAFGEHIDPSAAQGIRTRTFKTWKMLWSVGSGMPLPVVGKRSRELRITDERVASFSWAGQIAPGRALLAYRNQAEEVVIMAVQFVTRGKETGWLVEEAGRFAANGLHTTLSSFDPDYVPRNSMFSLKWSPWAKTSDTSATATIAYISHNHVGFRRITLTQNWELDTAPQIQVEERDTTGICLTLFPDAFIDWENITWSEDSGIHARGVIATPMTVKPFQVSLTEPPSPPTNVHPTSDCQTTYASETDVTSNPITGLIIHPSDPRNKPPAPRYTVVRLSATASNQDWFQTTLPEEQYPLPQWAEDIGQRVSRTIPRVMALKGVSRDSDEEESEDEEMVGVEDGTIYVHPHRFRFWGIAASPGGGSTAVLYSRHSTLHSDKKPAAQVFFGWHVADENASAQKISTHGLTTEGRVWEWMYGNGEDVLRMTFTRDSVAIARDTPLQQKFEKVVQALKCVFCQGVLQGQGRDVVCANGHSFSTCVASGLPIMAPGISRVCAVCKSRCLNVSELRRIATEHLGPDASVGSDFEELCGGCRGKFVA